MIQHLEGITVINEYMTYSVPFWSIFIVFSAIFFYLISVVIISKHPKAAITFSILTIIYCIVTHNIGNIMNMLFANGILFSFVFIATDPISSSYTKKGIIILINPLNSRNDEYLFNHMGM